MVDVGANIGAFSLLAATLVGSTGHVVAVGASAEFAERLEGNARLSGADLRVVNTAISDQAKTLTFATVDPHDIGTTSIVPYDGLVGPTFTVEALATGSLGAG